MALLRKKYKGVTFDVVVPVSEPAFNFVRRHRSEMWPDAWVFFYGVPQQAIQGIKSAGAHGGHPHAPDRRQDGRTGSQASANARRLLVVSGEPQPEKEAVEMARGAFADMPEVEFAFGVAAAGTGSTGGTRASRRDRGVLSPSPATERGDLMCRAIPAHARCSIGRARLWHSRNVFRYGHRRRGHGNPTPIAGVWPPNG